MTSSGWRKALTAGSSCARRKTTGLLKSRTSTGGGYTSDTKPLKTQTGRTSTPSMRRKHWPASSQHNIWKGINMSSKITVSPTELKEMDRRRFDREYSKWNEWQWEDDWIIEDTQDRYANLYKLKGIDIETLHYSVSYSQSDYASFTGRVYLADWMRAVNVAPDGPTYAERYPALYLACDADGSYIDVKGEDDRRGWRADYQENWYNTPPSGIFANMPEEDWEALVLEQASEADLETEIIKYCRSIGRDMYRDLSDYFLEATSEDAFLESCEANDITFEVEIEDEVPA